MFEPALLEKLVIVGTILLATGVAAWLLARFLRSGSVQGVISRSESKLDDKLLNSIRLPAIYAVTLIGVWLALQEADFLIDPNSETTQTIFFILFLSLGYLAAIRVLTGLIDWYRIEVASKTETTLDDHILPFFRRLIITILFLIALVALLGHFDVNVSALVTTLGIGTLAVALAAQEVLSNIISGFIILIDRPFRIGDRIELEELGTWGDVQDITLHSTRILTRDHRLVSVPNALISKNRVVNYSIPSTQYRVETQVGVAYGTDLEHARQVMIEAVRAEAWVMKNKPIEALFLEFQDSGLLFRVRCWIEHFVETRRVIDKLNTALYKGLNEADIEIPFPQRVVHIYNNGAATEIAAPNETV